MYLVFTMPFIVGLIILPVVDLLLLRMAFAVLSRIIWVYLLLLLGTCYFLLAMHSIARYPLIWPLMLLHTSLVVTVGGGSHNPILRSINHLADDAKSFVFLIIDKAAFHTLAVDTMSFLIPCIDH